MNRFFLLMLCLSGTISLYAQVGINTKVPYTGRVLHIDGAGDNVSAVSVTAAQAANDIVIDLDGNMGVGTITPTAKLHIATSGTTLPIRIADGSEGVDKYLTSDENGYATWINKPTPNGIVYYSATPLKYQPSVYTTLPVEINSAGYSQITIPKDGNYVVTLRWWGAVNLTAPAITSVHIRLRQAGSPYILDSTYYYVYVAYEGGNQGTIWTTSRNSFTVSLFSPGLKANTQLYLELKPNDGYVWETGYGLNSTQLSNPIYYPSVMVYNI